MPEEYHTSDDLYHSLSLNYHDVTSASAFVSASEGTSSHHMMSNSDRSFDMFKTKYTKNVIFWLYFLIFSIKKTFNRTWKRTILSTIQNWDLRECKFCVKIGRDSSSLRNFVNRVPQDFSLNLKPTSFNIAINGIANQILALVNSSVQICFVQQLS